MATATPAKTCIKCGQDCSGKPRTKDPQGRYTCRECYDKVTAARAAQPVAAVEVKPVAAKAAVQAAAKPVVMAKPVAAAKAVAAAAPAAPAEEPALTFDDGAGFGEGLALEDMDAGIAAIASAQPKECQNCGLFLPQSTVICTRCGLNTQTGKVLGTEKVVGETRQCIKCGYSLKGLKSMKCPECGTVNSREDRKKAAEKKAARDTVRNAYLKPVLMFVVGLTISIAMAASQGAGTEGAIAYLIKYAFYVPTGVVVFFLCCLIWLGFDAPMHLTALRLAGVYAVTDAVTAVVLLVPLPLIIWLVPLATYVGLLMDVLDLEIQDAVIVGLVTFLVRFLVIMAVVAYLIDKGMM